MEKSTQGNTFQQLQQQQLRKIIPSPYATQSSRTVFDGKSLRRAIQRRTVDYNTPTIHWLKVFFFFLLIINYIFENYHLLLFIIIYYCY